MAKLWLGKALISASLSCLFLGDKTISIIFFFKVYFLALWLHWYDRKQVEREVEWHSAKGPRPGLEPGAAAVLWKHEFVLSCYHQPPHKQPTDQPYCFYKSDFSLTTNNCCCFFIHYPVMLLGTRPASQTHQNLKGCTKLTIHASWGRTSFFPTKNDTLWTLNNSCLITVTGKRNLVASRPDKRCFIPLRIYLVQRWSPVQSIATC